MRKYDRLLRKGKKYFRRITGMKQQVFKQLLTILCAALALKHKKG